MLEPLVQHIGRRLTLKQSANGTFIIGGGWPAAPEQRPARYSTTWESAAGNAAVAVRVMPSLADVRVVRMWTGVMAFTDDLQPVVGESAPRPGLPRLIAPTGFTLGPLIARLLAEPTSRRRDTLPPRTPSTARRHAHRPDLKDGRMDRDDVTWRGYWPACPTPFRADESYDAETHRALLEWYIGEGLHGAAHQRHDRRVVLADARGAHAGRRERDRGRRRPDAGRDRLHRLHGARGRRAGAARASRRAPTASSRRRRRT